MVIFTIFLTSYGEGNGNPLQYSCLENPMDRGAWWATVHQTEDVQLVRELYFPNHAPAYICLPQIAVEVTEKLLLTHSTGFNNPWTTTKFHDLAHSKCAG